MENMPFFISPPYKELGLNSETAVVFNITSKEQVIVNTLSLIHIWQTPPPPGR